MVLQGANIMLLAGTTAVLSPMFDPAIAITGAVLAVMAVLFFLPMITEMRHESNRRLRTTIGNVAHLMEIFQTMDDNQDGIVTLEELKNCLENQGKELVGHKPDAVAKILDRIDLNGDHLITWPEFRLYFAKPEYETKVLAQSEKVARLSDKKALSSPQVAAFTHPDMARTKSAY